MNTRVSWRHGVLISTGAMLLHGGALAGQSVPSAARPASELQRSTTTKVTLEGFVLAPDGSPAEGAVVVSSAGGRAVTDVTGSYRLELELSLEAQSVQISATGTAGGSLTASTSVMPGGTRGPTRVDPLQLGFEAVCSRAWIPTFGEQPGTSHRLMALTVCDVGDGPALFAGGDLQFAGGTPANGIARWNGSSWSALGSGMNDTVLALAGYDDGGGSALYAGGEFTTAGGLSANRIAKWDGSSWSPLGSGVNGSVLALAVYDDGGGPALYAAGDFTSAGGGGANRVAKWDGSSWAPLGSGVDSGFSPVVHCLAVFDDGSGSALHVGGLFAAAGGQPAPRLAKWNGTSWSKLPNPFPITTPFESNLYALTVFHDGSEPALYAGGEGLAKWDGSSWTMLGGVNGPDPRLRSLAEYDDGGGPALYVGGGFTSVDGVAANGIAKWDGASWSALGSGLTQSIGTPGVRALAACDDGGGSVLYAGGDFRMAGDAPAQHIARWNGSSWAALKKGLNNWVFDMVFHDEGGGPQLYAGGDFTSAGGVAVNRIARWDGASWSPLGSGTSDSVRALAFYDDGTGPALHAGGEFILAGGATVNRIAKWDGASWSALGTGLNNSVESMGVYDDGGGEALYVSGQFTDASGLPVERIARWDGSSWSAVGSGLFGSGHAMAVYDDGSGPALYVGGNFFRAFGVPGTKNLARWNGSSWSSVGGGTPEGFVVSSLVVHDDGSGPALYAAGSFSQAGGVTAYNIARWEGSSWTPVGSGLTGLPGGAGIGVAALAEYDDGDGPVLCAAGSFSVAGEVAANRIAKWDGSSWAPLGSGMSDGVFALAVQAGDGASLLHAGGAFASALDSRDSFIARWGCPLVSAPTKVRRR